MVDISPYGCLSTTLFAITYGDSDTQPKSRLSLHQLENQMSDFD